MGFFRRLLGTLRYDEYMKFESQFSAQEIMHRKLFQMAFWTKAGGPMYIVDAAEEAPAGEIHYGRIANHARDFLHSNVKTVARMLHRVGADGSEDRPECLLVCVGGIRKGEQAVYDYGPQYFKGREKELPFRLLRNCICSKCKRKRQRNEAGHQ